MHISQFRQGSHLGWRKFKFKVMNWLGLYYPLLVRVSRYRFLLQLDTPQ